MKSADMILFRLLFTPENELRNCEYIHELEEARIFIFVDNNVFSEALGEAGAF